MTTINLPPVPQGLREMLKDYPEHIQTLQEDLNKMVAKKSSGVDPFDRAIWMLESALSAFISEARAELKVAEESGDSVAIERAEKKLKAIGPSRFKHNWGDDNLFDYFQTKKGASA